MIDTRRSFGAAALGAVLACAAAAPGFGQAYPQRPITLIVPFAPGGSTSVMARIIADKMGELLGQNIVVDNRPGAGGTLAARAFVRMAPDGYSIFLGYSGTIAIGPSLYRNVGFDPRKDFAPIGLIGEAPAALAAHPSLGVNSVAELIERAKLAPGSINYGSAGVGTVTHIAGELFASLAGIKLVHVPYKGSGPVLNDLVGGHIPMSFTPIPAVHGHFQGGTLKPLAVTGTTRSSLLPEVPTLVEAGLPGYEAVLHYGLLAPSGTPRPIIDKLNSALRQALASPEVLKRLAFEGADPRPSSPEEYAADIDQEETKWSRVLRDAGIKPTE
jgi:tripartite-type tricarboxylate transporter receptor subunit TctC